MLEQEAKIHLPLPEATRTMKTGETVRVDARAGPYKGAPSFSDSAVTFAELTLSGGPTAEGRTWPEQKLYLLEIKDSNDENLQRLKDRAVEEGVPTSPYMVVAKHQSGGVRAMAFLPPLPETDARASRNGSHPVLPVTIIGRMGNLQWFYFGPESTKSTNIAPFDRNRGVARRQLEITGVKDEFYIKQLETTSRTEIGAAKLTVTQLSKAEQPALEVEVPPAQRVGAIALIKSKLLRQKK